MKKELEITSYCDGFFLYNATYRGIQIFFFHKPANRSPEIPPIAASDR